MAELEVHAEHEGSDPTARLMGIQASIIALFLAVATIASHRAHTESVLIKAEANDLWALYQSKRIKLHTRELGKDLLIASPQLTSDGTATVARYTSEIAKYKDESAKTQDEAREKGSEVGTVEARAFRYDVGEGLLEIGLILTSLYFISRNKVFPVLGLIAGVAGLATAASGLLLK